MGREQHFFSTKLGESCFKKETNSVDEAEKTRTEKLPIHFGNLDISGTLRKVVLLVVLRYELHQDLYSEPLKQKTALNNSFNSKAVL